MPKPQVAPSQVRELKLPWAAPGPWQSGVAPSQVRELKRELIIKANEAYCRTFTGA